MVHVLNDSEILFGIVAASLRGIQFEKERQDQCISVSKPLTAPLSTYTICLWMSVSTTDRTSVPATILSIGNFSLQMVYKNGHDTIVLNPGKYVMDIP